MTDLFNSNWFIQLLVEQVLLFQDNNVARLTLLKLFCVNRNCAKFGRDTTKFYVMVTDDSNMPVYQYHYIYNTHFDALCGLLDIMEDHPPFVAFPYQLCFYMYRIFPQYKKSFYERFRNSNKQIFPFYLQTKISGLYHSNSDLESDEYSFDDSFPKKDIFIDDDLDPRGL